MRDGAIERFDADVGDRPHRHRRPRRRQRGQAGRPRLLLRAVGRGLGRAGAGARARPAGRALRRARPRHDRRLSPAAAAAARRGCAGLGNEGARVSPPSASRARACACSWRSTCPTTTSRTWCRWQEQEFGDRRTFAWCRASRCTRRSCSSATRPRRTSTASPSSRSRTAAAPSSCSAEEVVEVPPRRPRLYALGLKDDGGALGTFQERPRRAPAGGGLYEPEKRPFWPHITLARFKQHGATRRDAGVARGAGWPGSRRPAGAGRGAAGAARASCSAPSRRPG